LKIRARQSSQKNILSCRGRLSFAELTLLPKTLDSAFARREKEKGQSLVVVKGGSSCSRHPRSQILFGNVTLLPAKFYFALTSANGRYGIGNKIASASAFLNEIWERGEKGNA
jgi:hypothetical protein